MRARFIATPAKLPVRTSLDFPLILNTGRVRDHWHTMTRTGKSARLSAHIAEPFAEIHPMDAAQYRIADADLVEFSAENGARVIVRALLTERQSRGSVFVPMHWTGENSSLGRIDALVPSITDPVSGQPALKHVPVAMKRYAAKAYGFAVSVAKPANLDAAYWVIAKADGGWRVELGFEQDNIDWETWARKAFAIPADVEVTGYADARSGDTRLAFFAGQRFLAALFVAASPVAVSRNWLVGQLRELQADADLLALGHAVAARELQADTAKRYALIAGRPSADRPDPGAIVCSCFSVGVNQITGAVRQGCSSVEAVGATLSAGTNCGSCRSEIRRIIDACHVLAAE